MPLLSGATATLPGCSGGGATAAADGAADGGAAAAGAPSSSRLRRVASAPAFKHASCYLEPSPAAAVAAAAAEAAIPAAAAAAATGSAAAAAASSSSGGGAAAAKARTRLRQQQARSAPRAQQQPCCGSCQGGPCRCLEVYVVSRSFTEFGGPLMKRLPQDARDSMVDMGLCHYMTVFKTPDGQLVQFDFGPQGGDVAKAHGPLAALLRRARIAAQQQQQQQRDAQPHSQPDAPSGGRGMVHSPSAPVLPIASLDLASSGAQQAALLQQLQAAAGSPSGSVSRPKRGVVGEIRERSLQELPAACMYMGRTSLSLDDIRRYNAAQGAVTYTLHEHDCRHYVNSLVQYTTGVERSTQHLKRHYFVSRHSDRWLWYGWVISATQLVTDVGNWSHVQAGAAATLLAVTGRSTLASLKTLALPVLPAIKALPAALLPSAAAAGGAGAAAAAAAGGGGGGPAMIATLATTLKLPAALLLKRPLAAGAAAGGAGAAAVVMRGDAAAAGGGPGPGPGAAQARPAFVAAGAFGSLGRPLRALGDGVTHGLRAAVLGIRRLAVGNGHALQQLQLQQQQQRGGAAGAAAAREPVLAGAAAGGPASGRGWWARRQAGQQQQQQQLGAAPRAWWGRQQAGRQLVPAAASGAGLAPASAPAAAAAVAEPAAHGAAPERPRRRQQQQQHDAPRPAHQRVMALGHHVGRHMAWLGSAAARASGQLVGAAFGGGRAAGGLGAGAGGSLHLVSGAAAASSSSSSRALAQRSRSSPSLALAAPAAAAGAVAASDPGTEPRTAAAAVTGGSGTLLFEALGAPRGGLGDGGGGSSGAGGVGVEGGVAAASLDSSDFVWCSGGASSSLVCSSVGGRASGVGRQVLTLPPPRLSWGKRASQAVLVVRQ